MKILALGPNSTKFYTHNLWATRRLEMQKRDADGECNQWCGDGGGGAGDPGRVWGWNGVQGV